MEQADGGAPVAGSRRKSRQHTGHHRRRRGFRGRAGGTDIGRHFSQTSALDGLGILFPFLLTSVLKTAQGSSTVAIITAASIVQPLLPALGLATEKANCFVYWPWAQDP